MSTQAASYSPVRRLSASSVCKVLREHAHRYLNRGLDEFFPALEEALFQRVLESASNVDQTIFEEACDLLKRNSADISAKVQQQFLQQFDAYFTVSQPGKLVEVLSEELSLLDQSVWEDDLAISILASRAESACTQALWALNQRVGVVRAGRPAENRDNPIAPAAFAKALQHGIADLDITEKAKSVIYEQFNINLLVGMPAFLDDSNSVLIRQGILPDLRHGASRISGTGPTAPTASSANEANNVAATQQSSFQHMQESLRAEQSVLDAIINLQLQNLAVTRNGITAAGVSFGGLFQPTATVAQRFSTSDYVAVLNALQSARKLQLEEGAVNMPSVLDVQQELVGQLSELAESSEQEKKLAAADAGTIDLVGTIFNQILQDDTLCSKVKALLSHLHTPFLKIALIDQRFMQDAEHPARMLLNELAEAGAYWVSDKEDKFKVYDKLYQLVHRTIDDFDEDVQLIEDLREDFRNFLQRLDRRVELSEKRSQQAEEGLDKIESAKAKASEVFRRTVRQRAVAVAAADILEQAWVDFLAFVYLRFGADSETWKKALAMLNQAFVRVHASLLTADDELRSDSLAAELEEETGNTGSAQSAINQIDKQLRIDVLALGYAEQDVDSMFELIEEASSVRPEDEWRAKYANRGELIDQEDRNTGLDIGVSEQALEALDAVQDDLNLNFSVRQLDDDLDEKEKELRESLKNISYGTWFEWLETNGAVEKKLKLAWYSSMSDNYMFVNQAGVKVLVESLNNLTRSVHRGNIRIINMNNESFMERLFKRVVGNLEMSA